MATTVLLVAELIVGGMDVEFGYTTLGATLDITPPLMAPGSILGDACSPLGGAVDVTGKVFVQEGERPHLLLLLNCLSDFVLEWL